MTAPSIRHARITRHLRLVAALGGAILLGGLAAGCTVPDADTHIAAATAPSEPGFAQPANLPARIEGADGTLSGAESAALLTSIEDEAGGSDILARHLATEADLAGTPLTADNAVTVLRDGAETFHAIAAALRAAQHHINLEYYTIEDVILAADGTRLVDLLIERRQAGIAINILYDAYGSSDTPADFFTQLADAGVNLLAYHPIDPLNALDLNDRDHRKIVVVDGAVAVVGGVNLSKSYESKSPGSDDGREEAEEAAEEAAEAGVLDGALGLAPPLPDKWRDTAVRIEGPAVAQVQTLFREHWLAQNGPALDADGFFPEIAAQGDHVVRIIGSTPDEETPRYYVTLISALSGAEQRAWISSAYFVPTPEQMEELLAAAERGVDVRLLLAARSDSEDAIAAARTHYGDLLEAGVRIFETREVVMHAKTVVIDGVWSAIGSSNFDYRSVVHNAEVEAIVLGAATGAEMERVFTEGMAIAEEIDPETWEDDRTLPERLRGFFSRTIEYLL